ncbi:MAG: flagellar biosynthesis protein FlhB [Chlorobiaceae bacterium]|nr:flagellar biosynthesis protein FlhB [Chlorobiaceae bacterium]MBA4309116.1 flagellar biosynthesis protein FlhB [Chlorobiaceae bacterium]
MPEVDGQDKSEQPTSKKIDDSRDKGQVAKSVEINSLAVFTVGFLILITTQKFIGSNISEFTVSYFSNLDVLTISVDQLPQRFQEWFYQFLLTVGPILLGLSVIGLIANYGQVGFKITPKVFIPKMDRFNPITGIKNTLFSKKVVFEVLKALAKLFIIGGFAYWVIEDMIKNSLYLMNMTVHETVGFMISNTFELIWKLALVYVAISAVDFTYQRLKHTKDLMMTKQEVKDEMNQTDGNPYVKSKIRSIQIQNAKGRMMQDVPTADVVITNPTHYAIALKYDLQKDSAPKVVAKGVDDVALRIRKIAEDNGIPIHEDKELARALFKMCDIGDFIPQKLFRAVATILAYVFQLKNNKKKRSIV